MIKFVNGHNPQWNNGGKAKNNIGNVIVLITINGESVNVPPTIGGEVIPYRRVASHDINA